MNPSNEIARSAAETVATILLIDDDPMHLKLTCHRLRDEGFVVTTAQGAEEGFRKALQDRYDAIVSDVVMGDIDGFALCRRLRDEAALATVPVILLSAHFDEDADRKLAARVGASALVQRTPTFDAELKALRSCLASRMPASAIAPDPGLHDEHLNRNVHHLARLAQEVEASKDRYRTLLDNASDAVSVLSTDGIILEANRRCGEMFGVPAEQMIGRHVSTFAPRGSEDTHTELYNRAVGAGNARNALPLVRADGSTVFVESVTSVIEVAGQSLVLAVTRDVTESVRSAHALTAAEERYRTLVEQIPDVLWTVSCEGNVTYITPNVTGMFGFAAEEIYARQTELWFDRLHPDDAERVRRAYAELVTNDTVFDLECRWCRKDGEYIWVWSRAIGVSYREGVKQFDGMFSDISEKKRLEEQVRLSQKLEAVGQLTGGIAHDFNNILAVILANCSFLLDDLGPHDQRREDVEQVQHAADRAVGLIRQLLAFSRRQVLEPTVMSLNSAVTSIEKMLRRLIGEDIELSVVRAADLSTVRADVGQIEQVIMNLVINARDAMPSGGKLAIETSNVDLNGDYTATHLPMQAGKYVMLAVSDTGCGMDARTKERMFEPFFTTKERGKGTGLGLATCYGIVKQSGGYIWADSKPGQGTVFTVYLPRIDGQVDGDGKATARAANFQGDETVLVIEDEEGVRAAVARMLTGYGYRVLQAANANEAFILADLHAEEIALILSDVVIPGLAGPQAVDTLKKICRDAKALFMSGYTDHAVLRDGVIETSTNFVQKPFTPESLAKKVRAVLNA